MIFFFFQFKGFKDFTHKTRGKILHEMHSIQVHNF